jgi:CSLREA domain-containing protein
MRQLLVVAAGALALCVPSASAETIDVTADDDAYAVDGKCSLREAITSANLDAAPFAGPGECANGVGGDTITVPAVHITLSQMGIKEDLNTVGDLDVLGPTVITGAGASATTVDAGGIDRVFDIGVAGTVTLQGVTITGGHAPDGGVGSSDINGVASSGNGEPANAGNAGNGEGGGGIRSAGTLTVVDSVVIGNVAGSGGQGGAAKGGDGATQASGGFGGVGNAGYGGIGGNGGGINSSKRLTLTRVVVTGNSAGNGGGGGLGTGGQGGGGISALGGGGAGGAGGNGGVGGEGGGVFVAGTAAAIDLSAITNNHAGAAGAGGIGQGGAGGPGATGGSQGGSGRGGDGSEAGRGGGVMSFVGTITVTRTLFAFNDAGDGGGGGNGKGGPGGALLGASGSGGAGGEGRGGDGDVGAFGGGAYALIAPFSNVTFVQNSSGSGGNGGAGTGGKGGAGGSGTGGNGYPGTGGHGGNAGYGGALNALGEMSIDHATITDNVLGSPGSGGAAAGGAAGSGSTPGTAGGASPGTAGNPASGGAIYGNFNATLRNSIVAGNSAPACGGSMLDGLHNISLGDPTCFGADVDPLLGPLADNGGSSMTRLPGPGSPALDAVPLDGAGCAATDQRGATRPHGTGCEIGAYEIAPPDVAITEAGATVQATVNPNARATTYHVEYGTTTAYGSPTPEGSLPPGIDPVAVSATLAGLVTGTTYHLRLVASNADGTTIGEDRTFTAGSTPGGGPGGGAADTTAPVFLSASVRPKTFKRRRGTTFRYRLSEAARVAFTIQRKKGKRYVRAKRFTKQSKAGANTRKLATHKLKPGRYRATLVATDAAGNHSKSKRLLFRIVR